MQRTKKSAKKRRWLIWGIELLLIVALVFALRAWQQRTLIEGEATDFEAVSLAGENLNLDAYRGEAFMLYFWASWCAMCELGQGGVDKVAAKWPVVTVAYSSGKVDEVKRYMARRGTEHWVTLIDNEGELADKYGVIGVPTTFIIDGEGRIRFREVGLSSSWGLRLRLWWSEHFG